MSSINAPKFFVDHKKGEVVELLKLLTNPSTEHNAQKKKDVVKRVIAYMTLGVDVSKLFYEMVKVSITDDIVMKKMVFLYIVNYAHQVEQGAFLAINTFLRDMKDPNPKIRGLALRMLCSIKFKGVYEYFANALYDSLKDAHPYVRKTAVTALLKVFHLNPKLITDKDIDLLYEMIGDKDPLVVMNVLFVLGEILKKEGGIVLSNKMVNHLLNIFNQLNEWGQVTVLQLLSKFTPKDQQQMFDIMNILEEYLKTSSGAIVLGVTKAFINFTKDNERLYPQVIKRLRDPLITLLSSCAIQNTPEIEYSILCHIYFLILKGGRDTFSELYKRFYAEYEEPLFIKKIKLKILVQIANDNNYFDILSEFEEYANEKSSTFGKYSIRKIGELALRVDSSLQAVVDILKKLLSQQVDYIVSESFCVLRDLIRKYPALINEFLYSIENSIQILSNDPRGLSALIFIIGEFGQKIENAPYILEYLSKLEIHSSEFAYSLLLAGCKLFFKSPGEMQPILGRIYELILKNYKDVDLRDRVYYYYNLMKKDINLAEYIICGQPNVVDYYYSEFDDDYIDQIFTEFNSLSIIYRRPEEKFIKYTSDELNEDEEEKGDDDEQIEDKPLPSLNKNNNNNTQNNNVVVQQIPPINENSLKPDYSIDENTYQNYWGSFQTYVHQNYKLIPDDVEVSEYVEYLKSKNIFTKAYGTNNGISTLFLFSCEKTADIVFITKLVLNFNNRQIEYELKTSAEVYATNYNKYLYENISPLIDQE